MENVTGILSGLPMVNKCILTKCRLSSSDINDTYQNAAVQIISKPKTLRIENPPAYVTGICRNLALDLWHDRERRRLGNLRYGYLYQLDHVSDPVEELVKEETSERVRDCIGSLPASVQEVLRLKYYLGLSDVEIAAKLEISLRVVYRKLSKAKKRLREKLYRINEE